MYIVCLQQVVADYIYEYINVHVQSIYTYVYIYVWRLVKWGWQIGRSLNLFDFLRSVASHR